MADADPAITALTEQVKSLTEQLKRMEAAAGGAKRAIVGTGDEAEKAAVKTGAFATAFGTLASNQMQRAIDGAAEWLRNIPEAAARSEEHARILQRLGSAYGEVQRATNGAISATQANRVQQTLAQAGLTLTANELANVTARAREYARATGVETTQALDQLTDALRGGEAEGLRRFGISVQAGTNKADAMAAALRQLDAQVHATSASSQTLAEASEELTRTWGEMNDGFRASLAEEIGLRDYFTNLTSWLRSTASEGDAVAATFRAIIGSAGEMVGLRIGQGPAQGQSRSADVANNYSTLLTSARAAGVDTRRYPMPGAIAQASGAEQQQLFAALARETNSRRSMPGAAGLFGPRVDLSTIPTIGAEDGAAETSSLDIANRIAGNVSARASMAGDTARKRAQAEAARRRAELASIRTANTSASSAPEDTTDLAALGMGQAQRDAALVAAVTAMYQALGQQQQQRDSAARGGSLHDRASNVDLHRQSAEANTALGRTQAGDFDPTSARGRNEILTDRIRILRDQRSALADLLTEAEREEQLAVRMERPQSEVNDLMRQRIEIQRALAQSTTDLTTAQAAQVTALDGVKDKLKGVLDTTVDGFAAATAAAIDSGESWDDAMAKMLRATMKSLVQMSIVEGLKNAAVGLGNLATGNIPGATSAFAAVGAWAAVGIAAGVGLAATRPSAPATGGGASPGAARADSGPARADRSRESSGPLALTINVSGALFDDGVYEGVARAVREGTARGYLAPGVV